MEAAFVELTIAIFLTSLTSIASALLAVSGVVLVYKWLKGFLFS